MKIQLIQITPNAERFIEQIGRTCYHSEKKTDYDSYKKFIAMIVKNGHESVFEHASATFRINGISRNCSHQLVRHRIASFSQKSQRYVSEDNVKFVLPPSIKENKSALELYENLLSVAKRYYCELILCGIKKEDARFVLPSAAETEIVITMNFRSFRNFFKLRTNKKSQWEIRVMAIDMLKILSHEAPTVFKDILLEVKKSSDI